MLTRVLLVFALGIAGLGFQVSGTYANNCSATARQIVAGMPRATLLSVQAKQRNNGQVVCVARIKIAAKNGKPPRVIVRRFTP